MPRVAFPLLCAVLAACAAPGGVWPSLAKRPIENAAPPPAAADSAAPVAAASPVADVATELATVDRDLDGLETRVTAQRAVTERSAHGGESSALQLETGRLDKLSGEVAEMRARLDGLAGRLAVAAAGGDDATAALRQTGKLIARADALAALSRLGRR